VSIDGADRTARIDTGNTLCERTGAAAVYRVGKIVVMWRPRAQQGEEG
jgi:RNA-binding protein YhbY